uniref:Dedicator of cytokinesis protein 3 n=1 Tax=Strigamia maritima TaxID=126957 RepID=T1IUW7_STRMM
MSLDDPIVREIASVLREWHNMWKKSYWKREEKIFDNLRKVMRELVDWRRQLICGTLTLDQIREIKLKITSKIDWGNRKLGLDLVPRLDSEMVDGDAISLVELYQVHVRSAENSIGTSSRGTVRRKELKKSLTYHLHFCMRGFEYSVGEDTEIYFSLFDAKEGIFISERFLIRIPKEGFSNYVEKLQNYSTLFTDLGNADLNRDLFIVAHIMRIGRMIYSESSKKSSQQMFKRPLGCAVLNLSEVLIDKEYSSGEDKEFSTKVFTCNESEFYQLHEYIIKKQTNKCSPLPGQPNFGIVVSVKVLQGEMAQVRQENPLVFKSVTITHKMGFSDVIMPGDVRNDLYFLLDKAEFEKGGKSTGKNIEVTLSVLDADGSSLEKCIGIGSGHENVTEYQSVILYHNNSPRWGETIKLAVPIERFPRAHVRMEFRHCSTRDKIERKCFGFAFAKLMNDDGTTVKDGLHELFVYKCDDRSKLINPQVYLNLPWSSEDHSDVGNNSAHFQRSAKETVFLETLLCSTKLTQNVDLLSLLKWKAHPDKIQETLAKVMKLNGEEIVKFLQDILDALFQMFSTSDGNLTAHSGQVFQALICIFGLLQDPKFQHFKPVMDTYITGHFSASLVYKGLLTCVQKFSDFVPSTDQHDYTLRCFRCLEYIFKFIIQSRLLFQRATGGQNKDSFRSDMDQLFTSFKKMLSLSNNAILHTQVALLVSLSSSYDQLLLILPIKDVAEVIDSLLDSLPADCPPQLLQAKLHCVKETIHSKLFDEYDSRILLLQMCASHIKFHLSHRQEVKMCAEILGEILIHLYKAGKALKEGKIHNCVHHEVQIIVVTILDVLIQTVLNIDRASSICGQLVTSLVALLNLMNECHYKSLWNDGLPDKKAIKEFLLRVFYVFKDLVRQDVYPKDWVVLKMVTNYVILTALEEFSQLLIYHFLSGNSFDDQLWNNYFNLAVAFLTQPSLQLENFSEVKREKIIEKYQDMRVLMGFQILSMWSKLGDNKINFIPSMVGPFLEVTLVPETELRKATLPIFFDMMDCEQKVKGNFKQVESELIDKLDILVSENKGDDEYRQLFNTILLDRVKSDEPAWKENGTAFINSVTRLLERLLDYRNVMEGDENRDKRMSCTVNLLNFYKNEINRKEMYIRYIYKLHDLHLPAENYTEAASTLKLHADQLTWSKRILHADLRYPAQHEYQRKETLYSQIIDYFDKGKCWEKGIPLCKELADLYEKQLYDYDKLSQILRTQARFFDNILSQLRPEPEYFRVGFYGMSFPLFVRNKLFIYRGLEYERIGAFTQRLQMEFPTAQILMKNTPPDETIMHSDCQYIQICNVRPIPEGIYHIEGHDIPDKIASFYLVNDVNTFQFDRPVHKGPIDKDNEFKSLWIERTTLVTASSLPGILRWFEVLERRVIELSPIEYACETMTNVNQQLRQLINQYSSDPKRNINPLSMRLQGIIDAAVMGGISKYQEAFFGPEFTFANPQHANRINQLKNLIIEQVQILEGGLSLHGRLAPANVQPLHKRLVECFQTMKQNIKES